MDKIFYITKKVTGFFLMYYHKIWNKNLSNLDSTSTTFPDGLMDGLEIVAVGKEREKCRQTDIFFFSFLWIEKMSFNIDISSGCV